MNAHIDTREFNFKDVYSQIKHSSSSETATGTNYSNYTPKRSSATTYELSNDNVFAQNGKSNVQDISRWCRWRKDLNDDLIDVMDKRHRIFAYPNSVRYLQRHEGIMKDLTEPTFTIDKSLSDFVLELAMHDYMMNPGRAPNLGAEAFLSFGIPRVKIRFNKTFVDKSHESHVICSPDSGCSLGSPVTPTDTQRQLQRYQISDEEMEQLKQCGHRSRGRLAYSGSAVPNDGHTEIEKIPSSI